MAASVTDFYKNDPSFLQRHLPLWLTVYVQRAIAVLLTAIAIGIPLFNLLPKLYRWLVRERIFKLYRRLRVVEKKLQSVLSAPQLIALESDVDTIDRDGSILPIPTRHSEVFFSLKAHIDLIRTRLAARLVEAHSQAAKIG